jgi:GTP-binding protein EngB required for normal cell division
MAERHTDSANDSLRREVLAAAGVLERLAAHREELGAEAVKRIMETVADVRARLDRKALSVAVVGEKKAGKSTFLNAILGARVLGVAVREFTGTVTTIQRADRPRYRARMGNGSVTEFNDVDSERRIGLERDIRALCSRLNVQPALAAVPRAEKVVDSLLSETTLLKQRAEAEVDTAMRAYEDLRSRQAVVAADIVAKSKERDVAAQRAAEDRAQIEEVRKLQAADFRLKDAALSDIRAITGMAQLDASTAEQAGKTLAAAEAEREKADVAAPFFLRKSSPWAFWNPVLRSILGWRYRPQAERIEMAAKELKRATAVLAVVESNSRLGGLELALTAREARLRSIEEQGRRSAQQLEAAKATESAVGVEARAAEARLAACRKSVDTVQLQKMTLEHEVLEARCRQRFHAEIHALTDMELRGREVAELMIEYPATHLPGGIRIIDTPGVNTDVAANRERAWSVIRSEADGCILITDLQQVVSRSTKEFLLELKSVTPHILLVMTKVDKALENASEVGGDDGWQQVEEARRAGVRRFAREVGRDPGDVFSIAVAAEAALVETGPDTDSRMRFAAEARKLFELLASEKAVVLSARAASGVRFCVERIAEAQAQAERTYAQRIEQLERQRLPDPADFQARQLARIDSKIDTQAAEVAEAAQEVLSSEMAAMRERWRDAIYACSSKDEVKTKVANLSSGGRAEISQSMAQVQHAIAEKMGESMALLQAPLLLELQEKYRIAQTIAGNLAVVNVNVLSSAGARVHSTNLHSSVSGIVSAFENERMAIGAGGAMAGAALGTIIMPGVGTVIGAALGALAGLFKTLDSLKTDCVAQITRGLSEVKESLSGQLATVEADSGRTMREVLARGLASAVAEFQSWIGKLMAAEQAQLEAQRAKLSSLLSSRDELVRRDRALGELQKAVSATSRGLCA